MSKKEMQDEVFIEEFIKKAREKYHAEFAAKMCLTFMCAIDAIKRKERMEK